MADSIQIPTVPFALSPSTAEMWRFDESSGSLTVTAAPRTDIFTDPAGPSSDIESMLNAATLLGLPPAGDFQLSARVTVDFAATFDAGVLLLWRDEGHWGKLCFEFSPAGEPMVVSVVTRGVSDDANAFAVTDRSIWVRASRVDRTYAYHASADGEFWRMIRYFTIGDDVDQHRIGFEGQSPTGDGCTVRFDQIRFAQQRLHDMRDGS
jgi:regulation of enolase protein 1 (concanavalin A-like superfamily)